MDRYIHRCLRVNPRVNFNPEKGGAAISGESARVREKGDANCGTELERGLIQKPCSFVQKSTKIKLVLCSYLSIVDLLLKQGSLLGPTVKVIVRRFYLSVTVRCHFIPLK